MIIGGLYGRLGIMPTFLIIGGTFIVPVDLRGFALWQLVLGDLLAACGGVL